MENKPDIVRIIEQEGIELKRGTGICPFHADSKPSFRVNKDKQTFHCFGCGEHGDVISFIMKLKGISFPEALIYLGISRGAPVKVNPAIQIEKQIQKDYEKTIHDLYESLCQQSRKLHKVRIKVKESPGALTEQGAAYFAGLMGELAEIEFKIDILLKGYFEDKINLLRGERNAFGREIKQSAVA
ncbi:MAG TPA: CHC2 zinc finger domain-containing protein [Smithella sp.]|jgi:DNA primase|nr:MAG: DNA primase [bacterium ADurb.Bin157]HQP40666.1 CHC2 zinc finger domain-containing protein [Smithella sp.]